MHNVSQGIWPPSYDEHELNESINGIIKGGVSPEEFYVKPAAGESNVYQGDIIELSTVLPLIDDECEASVVEGFRYWIVIGNTCDISRDISDVKYTQVAPIIVLDDIDSSVLSTFKNYKYNRRFFLPAWNPAVEPGCAVEFTMPVTVNKESIQNCMILEAKLTYPAWILLNACLVRYIARGDGRCD